MKSGFLLVPLGAGIQRFTKAGVLVQALPGAIKDLAVRQFVVDKVHDHIYFAINRSGTYLPGIYRSDMSGNNIVAIYNDQAIMGFVTTAALTGFSDQGYVAAPNAPATPTCETIFVTGMDIDVDEMGKGYLYFGYRNKEDSNGLNAPQAVGAGSKSGIMRYKLDGTTPVDFLLKGYAPYGLAIDQVKR